MANNSTNNQNQANIKSISEVADNNNIFFEIPSYQRLYEWNKEQIQTLLNDIKAKFGENKEYFIGNVVVSKKDNKNNQQDNKYLLIDGQQRLTTLFLIGFFLSYKCCNQEEFIMQGDKLRISMPIREKEEKVLKEFAKFCSDKKDDNNLFLQEIKKFPQDISQNIPQALEIIVNWFEENIKEENIKNFSNFIYSNVKFVFVELAENTDLNRFFIRMNNRGKQLEKHEILKARLLSKNDKIEDENERVFYAHIWDICSQMDNYIFQKASDRKISKSNESSEDYINKIIEVKKSFDKPNQDKENQGKFKSIVDFPTFLLHVYKLTLLEKNQNGNNDKDIIIDKNKLLEIIKIKENDKENTQNFIKNLLKYRILFDYFVVKGIDDVENSYKIRKLSKNTKNSTYTISEDSNEIPNLAMVQNYLRVARSGMSNNHHHWLTPFLNFLDKKIKLNFSFDELSDDENIINRIQIKCDNINYDNINYDNFITKDKKVNQEDLISFLENLDTALAKEQASTTEQNKNKKDLLEISNEVLRKLEIKDEQMSVKDTFFNNEDIKDLDQGTATPHYWFYRLEYYLWKNAKVENDKVEICDKEMNRKKFDSFYFRNLNSIEHVQAQSKAEEWGDDKDKIDNFGNLALISSSFNSSLNNQDVQSKYRDFQKRYIDDTKKPIISLKLWLIYAPAKDSKDEITWTFKKAEEHKEQMLEILKNSFKAI